MKSKLNSMNIVPKRTLAIFILFITVLHANATDGDDLRRLTELQNLSSKYSEILRQQARPLSDRCYRMYRENTSEFDSCYEAAKNKAMLDATILVGTNDIRIGDEVYKICKRLFRSWQQGTFHFNRSQQIIIDDSCPNYENGKPIKWPFRKGNTF